MTLRYDDLPTDGMRMKQAARTTPERKEWQDSHEPLITVRVWLGPKDGGVLTAVGWAAEVDAETNVLAKPIEEMAAAAVSAHEVIDDVCVALRRVIEIVGALGGVRVDTEETRH